jgi:branched-chain amino acid transport system ATP-binding protein
MLNRLIARESALPHLPNTKPSTGAVKITDVRAEVIRSWARAGVAVLIVEQQIDLALSLADRALVLERGAVTLSGSADELKRDPRVQEIYLGVAGAPGAAG